LNEKAERKLKGNAEGQEGMAAFLEKRKPKWAE
jgi:1,4-dihydroxy-2-naphthoyl-CoA synthase